MKIGNIIEGLTIIQKYTGPDSYTVNAEHDQIWAGDGELPVTDDDKARMEELGWFIDEECDGWSAFP